MLVLSRKSGESIRIGDGIVVTITEIRGGRVKVGISAPDACVIRRGELEDWHETPVTPAVASETKPLASKQLAANNRRSTVRSAELAQTTTQRPAADARVVAERKLAANRVRLAMELPATQFTAH